MLKVPTRLLLHSREETGVASIDRIAFWCVPNQYQRTKCRFNEDPLAGPKRKSVGVFVCPFWVKSRHRGTPNQCPLYPKKRTLELGRKMSAFCQKRTYVRSAPFTQSRARPGCASRAFVRVTIEFADDSG